MKFTLNLGVSPFRQATQAPNSQLRSNSFATTGTVIGVAAAAVAAASNGAVRSRKAAVAFWQQGKSMPEPHAAQFISVAALRFLGYLKFMSLHGDCISLCCPDVVGNC